MRCKLLENFGKVFSNNKIKDIHTLRLGNSALGMKSKEKFSHLHKKTCKISLWRGCNGGLETSCIYTSRTMEIGLVGWCVCVCVCVQGSAALE